MYSLHWIYVTLRLKLKRTDLELSPLNRLYIVNKMVKMLFAAPFSTILITFL